MADPLQHFFALMEAQGFVVVQNAPKLDLELYIQNYRGRTRFERLFFIGRSSVTLCVEALKAAVAEAKQGRDVQRYREAVECLRVAAPNDPAAVLDKSWVGRQDAFNRQETARILAEIKVYKNNLVKESIRIGHEDLGKHLESIGDLAGATEAFNKMRPDVSTVKQLLEVGKHLIRTAIQRREWGGIHSHFSKLLFKGDNPDEEKTVQPYVNIAKGITHLYLGEYQEACDNFLTTESNTINTPSYAEIASRNDVAVYGGLLALATMNRIGLQHDVLDNDNFRGFLETEPHIRRAINAFVTGRYSACIQILETYRPDYLLDIHLHKHISTIYSMIRSKCIVQYLLPFSCIKLQTIAEAFSCTEQAIASELADMIQQGKLKARINLIDGVSQLLSTVRIDPRTQMQAEALASAEDYERQAIERLRRMSLAAADLELRQAKQKNVPILSSSVNEFEFQAEDEDSMMAY
ncbi:26S proteasome subunit RPN7-domain-containing protein [Podospora fimiseda]|uniref:26S proteasome subunit RPN7-domain-containing protein n=1 Tax=Podospora fimiseda TaxID=252190 RepID=A0AAN7H161_9PEZI|nr:26S proteasome subunit RPN7-domain-containing protein [Podospora fimiseda]